MIGANRMIVGRIGVFVLAMLGAALTDPLQDQVDSWEENLTTAGQTAAATVVALIPLLFWVLLAVGIILSLVATFLPGKLGGLRTSLGSAIPAIVLAALGTAAGMALSLFLATGEAEEERQAWTFAYFAGALSLPVLVLTKVVG